ncbi:hypothetical protein Acid345_2033 [Candidatus Koribacter versatilis Ellin345]|uniref:Uncharacterized protein n=1 Tax=Koribacter versatilis (strain Ellin345) TaxID=204669 RepID=Q1IQ16_KORVE|nr:hypothetical protein [Candidatus Koribacter versatilis]ABF41034.1 hypothetical protein Acid345_2033 [Candidatus Koribacter versatilis Ellin345]
MIAMLPAVHKFIEAHDRYLALDEARTDFPNPRQRELYHIEIMKAYLEVQYRAKVIAGIQYADGMDFADRH